MTKEQELMFEQNENLIHTAIKTYVKKPGIYGLNDYEDLFQVGSIGLMKAIEKYDPEKGRFSTFAMSTMRNELYGALKGTTDISKMVPFTDEMEETRVELYVDSISGAQDNVTLEEGLQIVDECGMKYGGIAEKGARAIHLMLLGYSTTDIAEMFGVEPKTLTAWMSRARNKLQNERRLLKLLDMA